ncbi:response regulator [Azospirillum doebereinerae]|uniref:response regulator n=1 Tax=Azospirillum doebereinerae TaxID=92933 RepID=UPI001FD430FC|nr:response regulator [Azospirillum doebereinerae]
MRANGTAGPLRILLAEDEAVNRMAALAMLRRAGHTVVAVEDGPSAVAAATGGVEGEGFDLVLMDLGLPGFDGDEAVRRINARSNGAVSGPRILMLTATATPGGLERCQGCGADGVLSKPLRLDALEAALRGETPVAVATPDAFDPRAIAQMRDLLPPARVAELIGKTAGTLRQYRVTLAEAWRGADRPMLSMMAHKVAGVSAQYGCLGLRRAAQALEAAVEAGPQDVGVFLEALDAAYGPALAYLDARAAETAAF